MGLDYGGVTSRVEPRRGRPSLPWPLGGNCPVPPVRRSLRPPRVPTAESWLPTAERTATGCEQVVVETRSLNLWSLPHHDHVRPCRWISRTPHDGVFPKGNARCSRNPPLEVAARLKCSPATPKHKPPASWPAVCRRGGRYKSVPGGYITMTGHSGAGVSDRLNLVVSGGWPCADRHPAPDNA
jgi:hypothetical protein